MTQSNPASLPARSRRRSHTQSFDPEGGEQNSVAGRRFSLVRSNAVSRKQGSTSSPGNINDEPDFPNHSAHWTHTVEPNKMPRSSDLFAFLRGTRAENNQNGTSKCAIHSRDDGQISRPPSDLSQQFRNLPCSVCEGLSTGVGRLLISNQDDDGVSTTAIGEGGSTAKVGQQQDGKYNHDPRQESSKPKAYSDTKGSGTRIEALEKELEELKVQLQDSKRLLSSLGPAICTRRGVMVLKAMQHQQKEHPTSIAQGENGVGGFDDILSLREAADISQALDTRPDVLGTKSTRIRVCVVCNIPRFVRVLSFHTTSLAGKRSEFSSDHSTTKCCQRSICDSCFVPGLMANLFDGVWSSFSFRHLLKCPIPDCQFLMPIFDQQQLRGLLQQLGDEQCALHEAQFTQCLRLRDSLYQLYPRPTADAIRTAAALHRRLIDGGWMRDPSEMVNHCDVNPLCTNIQVVPVDTPDGTETLQIPIFVDYLILKTSRECIICTESPGDIAADEGDEERWSVAIRGFGGDWAAQIRPFPSPSALPVCSASHALDICRSCIAKHIRTHLDVRGTAGCESLKCPYPDCRHKYTHEEVRKLADPEVFARYDKLKLLSVLSGNPDFRWCLREGCEMGQIHLILDQLGDGPLDRRRNHVECEECGFEMCFKHQIPWHRGLSCAEYDRMRANMAYNTHEQATQEWLLHNTKTCRCGAYVEKKGGCFHMTCSSCGFEFCWECMADWKVIQGHGLDGRYDRLAHTPGCWFRRPNATIPTQVHGDTLEDALRYFE